MFDEYEDEDEFDGVEMAIEAKKTRECEHEYEIQVDESYTQDARKCKIETKTCTKCGAFTSREIWSEDLTPEKIRSM